MGDLVTLQHEVDHLDKRVMLVEIREGPKILLYVLRLVLLPEPMLYAHVRMLIRLMLLLVLSLSLILM